MQRSDPSQKFPIGSQLPSFELLNVDGKKFSSATLSQAKASLIVFTCNHCPYVKGSERMLILTARRFESAGLRTITISSNDTLQYPDDSYENMQKKSREMELPYPYLFDETQELAKKFDAACTPEAYLFDKQGKLVYHGAINDNPKEPGAVNENYISVAIAQVLAGAKPVPNFIHPIGCSIKWRQK